MRDRLEERLAALQAEFERGNRQLDEIGQEEERLRAAMLRISGAIQVLTEELGPDPGADDTPGGAA